MTETRAPRAPRPRRATALTRDLIIDGAVELIERRGVDALSMRRLGEELGSDATAFYRHFRDKDELVLAMLDRVLGEHLAHVRSVDAELDWRERLSLLARCGWQTAGRYPALYSMTYARVTGGTSERAIVDYILATLAETGLPPAQVVLLYRAFADVSLSLCGMKGTIASLSDSLREKDATAWTRIYANLPLADYPAARSHASELVEVRDDDIRTVVIDAILDRIQAEIDRTVTADR